MKRLNFLFGAATLFAATAGLSTSSLATAPLSGTVAYYYSYVENPGVSITFSDSPYASQPFFSPINNTLDYGGFDSQSLWPVGTVLFGADFLGNITVPTAGVYNFRFGTDDAAYLFINGSSTPTAYLAGGNGFEGSGAPVSVTLTLHAGANRFEIQYANEYPPQTALVFAPTLPEVSTWAMMLSGLACLGLFRHRELRKVTAFAA